MAHQPCCRCFRPADFPIVGSDFVLVIFVDASPVSFVAVAYLRVRYGDKIHVSFVMAKGRWAPLSRQPSLDWS